MKDYGNQIFRKVKVYIIIKKANTIMQEIGKKEKFMERDK